MKILIYCPVIDKPKPKTAAAIRRQRIDGGVVDVVYGKENPHSGYDYRNVLAQYKKAWTLALVGGYDALLTVEYDIIPPDDALQKLWNTKALVAYGMYLFRTKPPLIMNLYRASSGRYPDQSLSLFPDEYKRITAKNEIIPVSGVGFGCTLIRREALEAVPIRGIPGEDKNPSCDIQFAADCMAKKIKMVGHTGVVCGHLHDGKLLMPNSKEGTDTVTIKARMTLYVNLYGKSVQLHAGQTCQFDRHTALELQRAGMVEVVS